MTYIHHETFSSPAAAENENEWSFHDVIEEADGFHIYDRWMGCYVACWETLEAANTDAEKRAMEYERGA
jgi:hypothetical protein